MHQLPSRRHAVLAGVIVVVSLVAACTATSTHSPVPGASSPTPPAASPPPTTGAPASPSPTAGQTASASPIASPTSPPATESAPPAASPTDSPPPPTVAPGPFDPSSVSVAIEPFASGFAALTLLTNAGDGSGLIYVVEQRGAIHVLGADGTPREAPFLDIRERIASGGERGLLGLAFHPDYATNGRFFVDYTDSRGDTTVSEFARSGEGQADPASERVLLTINQPFSNHNGGMIAFGPDGYLYVATGDGGSAGDPRGNGQRLDTLLGKMLRIDVDAGDPYGIPADNPFSGGGARPEIWSYGLRNPWRFSFDRATAAMFLGDVGQNAREEINVEPAGEGGRNYGWNIVEGDRCYPRDPCQRRGLTEPVLAYGRAGNCSVTGGYVYRGAAYPALHGAYLFSDYCGGVLWGFDAAAAIASGRARMNELVATGTNPSSFGEDEAGELYLVNHGGEVFRIVAAPR